MNVVRKSFMPKALSTMSIFSELDKTVPCKRIIFLHLKNLISTIFLSRSEEHNSLFLPENILAPRLHFYSLKQLCSAHPRKKTHLLPKKARFKKAFIATDILHTYIHTNAYPGGVLGIASLLNQLKNP